ncbi:hypothetical protein BGZ76_009448 [Entomortierella beljakovae]|nr:hypothetical protein BGZ76_009448 [Entomortierella beljakovae]
MPTDLTAEELALEAMLESRLEIISSRLAALKEASKQLQNETQELYKVVDAKAKRMYTIEDFLLRLQGKPGLSNQALVNGCQPRKNLGIDNSEIEEFKMGVRTLRKKFQAASTAISTVGWWRHLKEKEAKKTEVVINAPVSAEAPLKKLGATGKAGNNIKNDVKLTVDTVLAMQSATPATSTEVKSPIIPLKSMLSPTSSSTKKRTTMDLQQIFSPVSAKSVQKRLIGDAERANPALGLLSPPTSPQVQATGSSLTRGLSLRS